MDDLVQFLHARLNEDEQTARAAHAPNWSTDGRRGLHYGVEDGWMTDALTAADADHIARHDPARTLREIDAKRRMIDDLWGGPDHEDMWSHHMRLLALPYANHPDYRPKWRPAH
ncbi:DUF6221 family protein [Streptomyces cyaneofuscatus]|uniref:DUF6221 family protein n=1 Tax=Streptomyces cyaneofuscatus TaxID=66883 RepID=UPI0013D99EA2|nr:DUF6221 family protein [Streptomyces cyaneofuscatus]NDZ63579.1 hypothetical protein [Streptomyces cyaneofuscatus]